MSSPHYPQSNGMAENAVNVVKTLFRKCEISGDDAYLTLMNYRSSPIRNGFSPAELIMGRKIRTRVPTLPTNLAPVKVDGKIIQSREKLYRSKYKRNYDRHAGARNLPKLKAGEKVVLPDGGEGEVAREHFSPRSYVINKDDGGQVRRNRRQLVKLSSYSFPPVSTPIPPTPPPPPVKEPPAPVKKRAARVKKRPALSPLPRRSKRDNFGIPAEKLDL